MTMMIQTHAFNSAWWGAPAGIVTDAAFFDLPPAEREAALTPFAWAEFKGPADAPGLSTRLAGAGFAQVDTQLRFRVRLTPTPPAVEGGETLPPRFADESPFTVAAADLKPFRHERFSQLPGVDETQIAARYALWAEQLIAAQPAWCLRLDFAGEPQGWFCASMAAGGTLELTLAMLHRRATLSGLTLYREALAAFARRGARLGAASFSVGNTDVHNLYARLGAHFLAPVGCWLWVRPGQDRPHR